MGERPYERVHLDEIESVRAADTLLWKGVRRRLGIGAFGINAYTAANPGDDVVEDHDELGSGAGRHEELYFVVSGHAGFTVAGEEVDAPAGTFVFVRDPAARRHARAKAPETVVLAIGGKRGEAYEIAPWEYWFAASPHVEAKDYGRAAEIVAEGLVERPDHPTLLYNLACYESLAGERDAALEHLARALELEPGVWEWARSDADLDPLREDPRYPQPPS